MTWRTDENRGDVRISLTRHGDVITLEIEAPEQWKVRFDVPPDAAMKLALGLSRAATEITGLRGPF